MSRKRGRKKGRVSERRLSKSTGSQSIEIIKSTRDMRLLDQDLIPHNSHIKPRIPNPKNTRCGTCHYKYACPLYDPRNPKRKCRAIKEREGMLKILNDPDQLRREAVKMVSLMDVLMSGKMANGKVPEIKEVREMFKSVIDIKNAFYPERKEIDVNLRGRKEIFASRIMTVMSKIKDAEFEEIHESELKEDDGSNREYGEPEGGEPQEGEQEEDTEVHGSGDDQD